MAAALVYFFRDDAKRLAQACFCPFQKHTVRTRCREHAHAGRGLVWKLLCALLLLAFTGIGFQLFPALLVLFQNRLQEPFLHVGYKALAASCMTSHHDHEDGPMLSAVKVFALKAAKQSAEHRQSSHQSRASVASVPFEDVLEQKGHRPWQGIEPLEVFLPLGRSAEVGLLNFMDSVPEFVGHFGGSGGRDSGMNGLFHFFVAQSPRGHDALNALGNEFERYASGKGKSKPGPTALRHHGRNRREQRVHDETIGYAIVVVGEGPCLLVWYGSGTLYRLRFR